MSKKPLINPLISSLEEYASKAISQIAKRDRSVIDFSFGEPEFGPPSHLAQNITENNLNYDSFLKSVKTYESSAGNCNLRVAICDWYKQRYGISLDPDKHVLITHGGVEAIALSIMCTTSSSGEVEIAEPSYMLYKRAVECSGRTAISISRKLYEKDQYVNALTSWAAKGKEGGALIVNSPENPSGYIASEEDWNSISSYCVLKNKWLVHDEVYDVMAYDRKHSPAIDFDGLKERCILINSFSKKFGSPGLRIGWMVGPEELINCAKKLHDYFYLGVNIQYESIAHTILSDSQRDDWLSYISEGLLKKRNLALEVLTEEEGFSWEAFPYGAMFLFPNISRYYDSLPAEYQSNSQTKGECVSNYLIKIKKVAVVPGYVYGEECADHIRLVTCGTDQLFREGLERIVKHE